MGKFFTEKLSQNLQESIIYIDD